MDKVVPQLNIVTLILKLFVRAPVYDILFAFLSPRALVRLALTCRAAYVAVAAFKSRAFNINRHFSRYFANPLAFRSLQANTNTLVSGSNALQFLDRTFYPHADLDIYTHPGHSREVARFLVEAEGYHFVPFEFQKKQWQKAIDDTFDGTARRVPRRSSRVHAYTMKSINAVWTFEKLGQQGNLKVQIIEADSSPLETIFGFHSTIVMNFISSDAVYSLYPIATFEERCGMALPRSQHSSTVLQKYIQRGWRIYLEPTPNRTKHSTTPPFFFSHLRWVGDNHTWVMPLDQTGVEKRSALSAASAPLTFDPVLCNGWKLVKAESLDDEIVDFRGYDCAYYPLRTTLFRYNYAIPDENVSFTIREWALGQGKFCHELGKEDWVWFDADIPLFLEREIRSSDPKIA